MPDPNGSEGLGLFLTYTTPDQRQEAQDRANTEAMLTATSPVPIDVGTIGTTVGFVPQGSPTALEQSTANTATSFNQDGDPSWRDDPSLQAVGGYIGGVGLGYVPGASPVMHLLGEARVIERGTPEARFGRAIGEILGGMLLVVGGATGEITGAVLIGTGAGAPAGAVAIAGSLGLVTAGAASVRAQTGAARTVRLEYIRPGGEAWHEAEHARLGMLPGRDAAFSSRSPYNSRCRCPSRRSRM